MSDARAAAGAFRIGTVFGIPIRIHFSFLLLLIWFGVGSAQVGKGFLDGVVMILLVLVCVVLHELGHAAAGHRFGVRTREIVLYPIGGVARMDRMPAGMAEFWIALAGPAVNFFLGSTALLFLFGSGQFWTFGAQGLEFAESPLLGRFAFINLALFAFNLFIPAFPMDGGRALRAGLSVFLGQTRATRIAARIGQGVAVLMAIVAIVPPLNPFLLLVAFFVFVGAGQEAAYERSRSAVAGLTARNAMITRYETIAPQESLGRAAELLLRASAGLSGRRCLGKGGGPPVSRRPARRARGARRARACRLEVMDREAQTVPVDLPLEAVLRYLQSRPQQAVSRSTGKRHADARRHDHARERGRGDPDLPQPAPRLTPALSRYAGTGSRTSGVSFAGLLTLRLTGYVSISAAGNGLKSSVKKASALRWRARAARSPARGSPACGRERSRRARWGEVVRMAQLSSGSPVAGSFHQDQRPARASGRPSRARNA